jgi:hypothetical protein
MGETRKQDGRRVLPHAGVGHAGGDLTGTRTQCLATDTTYSVQYVLKS